MMGGAVFRLSNAPPHRSIEQIEQTERASLAIAQHHSTDVFA
jgi:hypothetical protein